MSDPIHVLLIEDNAADAILIREMLAEAGGHALATADRLSSGLRLLQEDAFTVVLLDLGLPDSSGIETLLAILAARPDMPIVVLTGMADEELAARAIGLGAQDYLVKGRIDGELLSRAVRYAIERKKAQQLLRRTEESFRAFFESAGVGAIQLDHTGRFQLVNDRYCQITGYSREELLAMNFLDITHPGDRERDAAGFSRMVSGEVPTYVAEKRYIRKDGRLVWVQVTATLLRNGLGRPMGTAGIIQDITDRKRAEEARHESESRYRTLFESIDEGFCIIEVLFEADGKPADYRFLETNPAFEGQTGLRGAVGKRMRELQPHHEEYWVETYGRIALTGEPERFTHEARNLDRWYDVYAFRVGRPEERKVAVLFNDITARKRTEEELQKAQKLESIGLLAGGIAHDFNNILTAILGNINLARRFLPPEEKAAVRLAAAEQSLMRAKGLSQQLLTFAKGGAPITETIAVPHLVREALELALRGSSVRGEYFFPEDLRPVDADEGQLNQALSNLALNAVEAMPEGGVVIVTAANESLPPENAQGLLPGEYVRIDIKDQGIGIAAEIQGRIFDPYFTTKERGSGLGLAISFSIVQRHGGTITVVSAPGEGSTFSILLPASAKRTPVSEAEEEPSQIMAGSGRILVMDDEETVKDVAAEMLLYLGYQVETVRDGAEAVNAYGQALAAKDPFTAVIADITIPAGMGGKETVRHILEIDPQAKVIVSSGYGNDPIMSNYAEYGFKGVIPKPYKLTELGKTLKEVIGGKEK